MMGKSKDPHIVLYKLLEPSLNKLKKENLSEMK